MYNSIYMYSNTIFNNKHDTVRTHDDKTNITHIWYGNRNTNIWRMKLSRGYNTYICVYTENGPALLRKC